MTGVVIADLIEVNKNARQAWNSCWQNVLYSSVSLSVRDAKLALIECLDMKNNYTPFGMGNMAAGITPPL